MKQQIKFYVGIGFLGLVAVVVLYGWKVGVAAIGGLLAVFGIGKTPVQKVKDTLGKQMDKLDADPDPNAHALNIANRIRKRRARKNR